MRKMKCNLCVDAMILGDRLTGKSAIFQNFFNTELQEIYSDANGAEIKTKTFTFDKTILQMQIWDTVIPI